MRPPQASSQRTWVLCESELENSPPLQTDDVLVSAGYRSAVLERFYSDDDANSESRCGVDD